MVVSRLREHLHETWEQAQEWNRLGLAEMLGHKVETLLDLGCADGLFTRNVARSVGASRVMGVEIVPDLARKAADNGIEVTIADLDKTLPLPDAVADGIMSNQVIEHLSDTDNLVREACRLLKPGGVFVVSTENISAWYNVFAIAMGWQPFSLTNISSVAMGIGNPLAIHRGKEGLEMPVQHRRIFAPRGLQDLLSCHGLVVEELRGFGYFPLRGRTALWLSGVDPRHSAFIAVRARKK